MLGCSKSAVENGNIENSTSIHRITQFNCKYPAFWMQNSRISILKLKYISYNTEEEQMHEVDSYEE